jgi:hypothetical protein
MQRPDRPAIIGAVGLETLRSASLFPIYDIRFIGMMAPR